MKRALGVLMVLAGVGLGGWIAYSLSSGQAPEMRGSRVAVPLVFVAGLVGVGLKWARE